MILEQYYLGCLSHASYLVADETSKVAAVVDPQRDVDRYIEDAQAKGLSIRHVLLTHFHADFVAGHLELAERTGATIHLGAKARAQYAFSPLADGEELVLGPNVVLRALETPGHTPEGVSYLVFDRARDPSRPRAVLTGDTLFVGDVGRPDLMASVGASADELASQLYDSLHGKLLKLPDETLVYPAHGAGSMCGKNLSKETFSTIGAQRTHNYALVPMSKADFVAMATSGLPPAPAYFGYDAQLNKERRDTLDRTLERALVPLTLEALLAHQRAGGVVLDTREPDEYAPAHLAGSVDVGLSGKYATWAGTLLDPRAPIALIAAPGRERESAMRLGRVGFERIVGYLAGGFDAVRARPDLVRSFERVDPPDLAARLRGGSLRFLDVRQPGERDEQRIEGTIAIPLGELERRARELPPGPLAIHCAGGYRSTIAASLLERLGRRDLVDLRGGIAGWVKAGLPVARGAAV